MTFIATRATPSIPFPQSTNEDAVYLTGRARPLTDDRLREELARGFFAERDMTEAPQGFDEQELFEFEIDRCLRTVSKSHGDPNPTHLIWRAP
jgi:hypothetical protein